jgi:hypothetical protein
MNKKKTSSLNPALEPLEVLLGKWNAEIRWSPETHKKIGGPAVVRGATRFELIEDGQFVIQHMGADSGGPSEARWLFGRDETSGEYGVLYADARGVSRLYQMSLQGPVWRIWRNAPGFNQRFEGRIDVDAGIIKAHWEQSEDGQTWGHDFDVTYTRAE